LRLMLNVSVLDLWLPCLDSRLTSSNMI
jgi:hypothetical protein